MSQPPTVNEADTILSNLPEFRRRIIRHFLGQFTVQPRAALYADIRDTIATCMASSPAEQRKSELNYIWARLHDVAAAHPTFATLTHLLNLQEKAL